VTAQSQRLPDPVYPSPSASLAPASGTKERARGEAYVGEASGISLLETVLSSPHWTTSNAQLLRQLLARPQIEEPDVVPAALPSAGAAAYFVATYLSESHLQKPFLSSTYVSQLITNLYYRGDVTEPSPQDMFRLFMICAISAVPLRRRELIPDHPYGFFLSARTYVDRIPLLSGIEAVENLLLLARFAVYFHTGNPLCRHCRIRFTKLLRYFNMGDSAHLHAALCRDGTTPKAFAADGSGRGTSTSLYFLGVLRPRPVQLNDFRAAIRNRRRRYTRRTTNAIFR